jgi:hypothetical protein
MTERLGYRKDYPMPNLLEQAISSDDGDQARPQ